MLDKGEMLMESTIGIIISIIGVVIAVSSFVLNRKDKSNNDIKDESYHLGQIDTKLKNIEIMLNKIENKLDTYDSEIDDRIEKAINNHIKQYHKGE